MKYIIAVLFVPMIAFSQVPDTLMHGKPLNIYIDHDLEVVKDDTVYRTVPADSIDFEVEIRDSSNMSWFRIYRVPAQGEESVYEKRSDNLDIFLNYQARARAVYREQMSEYVESNWITFVAPDTTHVEIVAPSPVLRIIVKQD